MKVTINKIRVELQAVAEAHEMINSFFWGDFHRSWNEESLTYPLLCGYVASGGSLSKNLTNVPLTIVVADKVFKDYSSLNDTESDTLQVCRHIFNTLNMSPRWNALIRVNSASVEKFIDRGSDEIAGHILNMNVDIKDSYSICNLPMGDYDFESTAENGCAGVLIVNSDGTFNFTAPSGSIVDLPDTPVTVRNVSGDEVGSGDVPSVTGGVVTIPDCPVSGDGTAVLKDTDGNVLSTTNVAPETTVDIIAPDADYEIRKSNNAILYQGSIPSGGALVQNIQDSMVRVRKSDNQLIAEVDVRAESVENYNVADSTAVLKDSAGNTLSTTSIKATETEDIPAPDATVENSDATYTDTVASGGTLVLPDTVINITDQLGNPLDTITFPVYTPVNIDIDSYIPPCADANYTLEDTAGAPLASGNIPSGGSDTIVAPDGTVTITDTTPITLHTVAVKSNGVASQQISDSTVNVQKSDNTLINATTVKAEATTSYNVADSVITLNDSAASLISTTNVKATDPATIVAPDATIENSNASYSVTEVSGGTLVLPDSNIEVNGVNEGAIPSVQTVDIQVTDGTNPVTPNDVTVVGNTVTIEVPAGGAAPVGATLMKTGQTTSYRAGDDGDLEAGRATDFFTLASNNPFGNTNRFTDELGGQTYTDDIVIDWSTYNGATVLGWYRLRGTYSDITWDDAIDNSLLFSAGGFSSGWRLPNINELFNLQNSNAVRPLDYAPFNLNSGIFLWSSTTNVTITANAMTFKNQHNDMINDRIKTNTSISYRAMPCRTFTVTGTTLT